MAVHTPAQETSRAASRPIPHIRAWLVAIVIVLVAAAALVGYATAVGLSTSDGQAVSDRVMGVWATGEQADIDSTYAPGVVMSIDGEQVAGNRDEIGAVIAGAIGIGNTYTQVGPVAEYETANGDLYVATLVDVVGPGHPIGTPVIGFYRVRDGMVDRHILLAAEGY